MRIDKTPPISFDIQRAPPNTEQINTWRMAAYEVSKSADRRKRFVRRGRWVIILLFMMMFLLWYATTIEFALMFGNVYAAVHAVSFASGGFIAGIGASIVLFDLTGYKKSTQTLRNAANRMLSDLCDLNPEEHPDECIKYNQLRNQDPQVKAYYARLTFLDRNLVVAEWRAAQEWVESSSQQQAEETKAKAAHAAYERIKLV